MDPTLLTAIVSLIGGIVIKMIHGAIIAPAATPSATPATTATPATRADAFAGQPGLSGHPVRNLINDFLGGLLAPPAVAPNTIAVPATPSGSASDAAALSALASLLKSNPTAAAALKQLLA